MGPVPRPRGARRLAVPTAGVRASVAGDMLITVVGSLATAAPLGYLLAGRRHDLAAAISDAAVWVLAVTVLLQSVAPLGAARPGI